MLGFLNKTTRLGNLLLDAEVIDKFTLKEALVKQKDSLNGLDRKPLGEILIEMDVCTQEDIDRVLKIQDHVRGNEDADDPVQQALDGYDKTDQLHTEVESMSTELLKKKTLG